MTYFRRSKPPTYYNLASGVLQHKDPAENEFTLRLFRWEVWRPKPEYVEFSKESFDLLLFYASKIQNLLQTWEKAIIFQNTDVQVYVLQEELDDGFLVHFEDKRRVKVSMELNVFRRLVDHKDKVEEEYAKFLKEREKVLKS